ncbi:hypothetical protein ACG1BZ_07565 [Microbulbifer sp. CNSA002]|uniref:hypothetical protein n=1 Tax=Microbulbifer sp. CNSA002 TaxID=3373604 RepID=UPI0039B64854
MLKRKSNSLHLLLGFALIRWLLLGNITVFFLVLSVGFFYYLPAKNHHAEVEEEYRYVLERYYRLQRDAQFFEQVAQHGENIDRMHRKIALPYQSSSAVEQIGALVGSAGLTMRRENYGDIEHSEVGTWQVSGRLGLVGEYIPFATFVRQLDSIEYLAQVEAVELKAEKGEALSISVELSLYGEL